MKWEGFIETLRIKIRDAKFFYSSLEEKTGFKIYDGDKYYVIFVVKRCFANLSGDYKPPRQTFCYMYIKKKGLIFGKTLAFVRPERQGHTADLRIPYGYMEEINTIIDDEFKKRREEFLEST